MKSAKGGDFERQMCKRLSLWWTHEARDDVFWRASNSGGRATMRSKQGKKTFGHYGDIAAVDPIGQPLMEVCTLELKRGYSSISFADALDRAEGSKQQLWEAFVEQAATASEGSGAPWWILIQRRDKRVALVFMPYKLAKALEAHGSRIKYEADLWMQLRFLHRTSKGDVRRIVCATNLDSFLAHCTPEHFKKLAKSL